MQIEKYSLGIGDRFGMEGSAQLHALQHADESGVRIVPVWNKSNREHSIIGTLPEDARKEANEAVKACGWRHSFYVDADHIGLATVDRFLASSDFFTIDVADFIGKQTDGSSAALFIKEMSRFKGRLNVPGVQEPFEVTSELLTEIAKKYLFAMEEAGRVYRYIEGKRGKGTCVIEVSVDEANNPQSPAELFFILAAIAQAGIPIQTIAPKFTGSFLKGIDYAGDVHRFSQELNDDIAVLRFAVETFHLPDNLKLSIHSGSDKFSLYPVIYGAIKKSEAGLHLKTAGTTWLEEVIGLAASGGEGLRVAKEVYTRALQRYDELCKPYLTVIDIDKSKLPQAREVESWSAAEFVEALRHNQSSDAYNLHLRQLVHVGYKVAAEMGERFFRLLKECRPEIELNVTTNLFNRHIQPLFLGQSPEGRAKPPKVASVSMKS